MIIHPEYNKPGKFQNDIAIIKLDRDIEINGLKIFLCFVLLLNIIADYVSPVCLPFPEMMPDPSDVPMEEIGIDPEVAGWGAVDVLARRFADVLQYVVVPFADTDDCSRIYKVCHTI